ncbi:MAG: hypothetical protein CVV02_11070 [Firmicutes bacterium HGW-Firmicutes-7]|nr:MAG: hypothetical protein CVV02_11070 [Firmicutes bacterium HGW-Firmicutes-7]
MKFSGRLKDQALTLRPITAYDIETVRLWRNSDHIRKWFINDKIITQEEQRKWYESYLKSDNEIIFIIEESKLFHQPIGVISLYNIDRKLLQAEFGRMFIGLDIARGKGYGPQATKMICSFGFKYFKLNKIYLNVLKNNKSAIHAYKKIGFQQVKEIHENDKLLIHMELVANPKNPVKTGVLAFCFKMIPSATVGVIEPLKTLERKGVLKFEYKDTKEVTEEDIVACDVVICIRGAEKEALELVKKAVSKGKYIIYYLDDDLLSLDASYTYNHKYFNSTSVLHNIQDIMKVCNSLWTNNGIIATKYMNFFEKVILTKAPALLLKDEETLKEPNEVITIGYASGIDHRSFFEYLLYNPFERLIKEYTGKINIEILGFEPYYMHQLPIGCYPYIEQYEQYKKFMHSRNWDIGLAPLPNSSFNSCKYFNKYLEYGAINAAGIYSNGSPFNNHIRNEYNGLMVNNTVEDWYDGIVRLIEDEDLRGKISSIAERDLRENFSLDKISEDIQSKIEELSNYKS